MTPLSTALTAGALIVGGKWARDQSPNIDNAIGVAGIAIGLSLLEQMNKPIARAFSALILISLAIVHFPEIAKAAGLAGNAPSGQTTNPPVTGSGAGSPRKTR